MSKSEMPEHIQELLEDLNLEDKEFSMAQEAYLAFTQYSNYDGLSRLIELTPNDFVAKVVKEHVAIIEKNLPLQIHNHLQLMKRVTKISRFKVIP
jgi:hypothetical protein